MARNRMYQAIMPIRGKILNVEKASIDKVLANAEIKTMINAFGCGFSEGYGNDFDITKLRYNKIIIMADADVDGAHISNLLLTLFYRFMPELIFEGHVYIAMPPLYKAMPSKGEEEYLYDDKALEKYRKIQRPWRDGCKPALGNHFKPGNQNAEAGRNRRCTYGIGSNRAPDGDGCSSKKGVYL